MTEQEALRDLVTENNASADNERDEAYVLVGSTAPDGFPFLLCCKKCGAPMMWARDEQLNGLCFGNTYFMDKTHWKLALSGQMPRCSCPFPQAYLKHGYKTYRLGGV